MSENYDFTQESLVNIPYPEDTCMEEDGSLPMSEDVDLPPPPGALDNEPLSLYQFRSSPSKNPLSNENKNINLTNPENSENKNEEALPPFPFSPFGDNQPKSDQLNLGSEGDLLEDTVNESKISDDSKYSPSKVESDDENQDAAIKPKVLGKEQAKKRLMAFSLSKQINSGVKKQNKVLTPVKSSKEKPPNPNKSTNVQEQFRATITAIEEEKRKMMQNMPTYLLMEMSDLAKSTQAIPKSIKTDESDTNKNNKDHISSTKLSDLRGKDSNKRSSRRSRSRSTNRSKRRRRSRSRSKRRSRSGSRRRSRSRNKRSRSRSWTRKIKDDKEKSSKLDKKEKSSASKKDLAEDWKMFKASGLNFDNISDENNEDVSIQNENSNKRSPSPKSRQDFKPIYSYLKNENKLMAPLRARPADHNKSSPVLYSEKFIKYTKAKPIIIWSENPSCATEFCMSKEMLMENSDQTAIDVLQNIIESKNETDFLDAKQYKNRPWYPRQEYLSIMPLSVYDDLETDSKHNSEDEINLNQKADIKIENNKTEGSCKENLGNSDDSKKKRERTLSLVNDSYLSDEDEKLKEMVVGDLKVQMDVGNNSVKVCSRWDSDYEDESNEVKMNISKTFVKRTPEMQSKLTEKNAEEDKIENKKYPDISSNKIKLAEGSDGNTGTLASEYEEFLKMVSFDSNDTTKASECRSNASYKPETQKNIKPEEENKRIPKLEATDWDQESEHEEKSPVKKIDFSKPTPQSLLIKNEKLESSKKKNKKVSKIKKKIEKSKIKKVKSKRESKAKKKKYKDSSSSESSSDSYDSDSSSDSDDKKSKKKRKKKVKKFKKKSKKDSSSDSDSDSDEDKPKKKKAKKKKKETKKKKDSESEEDEAQTALLKQLDFKKQLIMKKIEEIDFISERTGKKKEKESRQKKKETLEDFSEKCGIKKKSDAKVEKGKKKSKRESSKGKENKDIKKSPSFSESSSESHENKTKKKKAKKEKKKRRDSSESSEEREKYKNNKEKFLDIKNLKSEKKIKKAKKKKRYSSSESSDDSSDKDRKKIKKSKGKINEDKTVIKEENSRSSWKENLIVEGTGYKVKDLEEQLEWESRSLWDKPEKKTQSKKNEDDWEASSSVEGSPKGAKSRESSWDDEAPSKVKVEIPEAEEKNKPEVGKEPPSETLKTSLSNFSFNENSFCSFGQELSRDFFLADRSLSNTIMPNHSNSFSSTVIESRPFQSVSKNNEPLKPPASELYSPGHSDSDLSEPEINEKTNSNSNAPSTEVYDPLNCDSEGSNENNEIEVGSIPLPQISDILLPGESKSIRDENLTHSPKNSSKNEAKVEGSEVSVSKTIFTPTDFTEITPSKPFGFEKFTPSKKQIMSVKSQPKLKSKAASVFQDESDEENVEEKGKDENLETSKSAVEIKEEKNQNQKFEDKRKDDKRRERDKSRERSSERDRKRKRSSSLERRDGRHRVHSPRRRKSRSPDQRSHKESKAVKNDHFELDSSKNYVGSKEVESSVQPITVVTGLGEQHWNRSHVSGYNEYSNNVMDSFDIYPSDDSKIRSSRNFEKDWEETSAGDKPYHREDRKKKESRRSRSRSASPRKRRRSKSPDRRRSPKRSRERSPYSPRRRSPKRRSSPRRYRGSRSPERRRKSRSRSPRRRRDSPRRSRSTSPRKHRSSPKRRGGDSPRRRNSFSPRRSISPGRKDPHFSSTYSENSNLPGRIPVIGGSAKEVDSESGGGRRRSPRFEHEGFPPHLDDPTVEDINSSFYTREYDNEFGFTEDQSTNNLITVKNHDVGKVDSPERLTLDQRIELELGVRLSSASAAPDEQYGVPNQQFQDSNNFNSSYPNDTAVSDNFYPNQGGPPDFNGQYFNGTQHGNFSQFPPPQTPQSSVMQVGNIMEVVPAMHPPLPPQAPPKPQQIMQVGNVLQVVPSPKVVPQGPPGPLLAGSPMPPPPAHNYGLPASAPPLVKTQKATAVVAPSSIIPTPNPEAVINPLIKAIQIEREKRRKEKEKRKAEREARRRARQLRREAKLMSVNEKLKKSVVDEGLMLGQEVEDDELLDSLDLPSPPVPVEIITVSSQSSLPPAGKGILISAGFVPKPASEKKEVKFADGILPGEGTSSSAGEEIASPPPKPKLPKEKRFKKKKTKVKKKVKVQIIKQIIQDEDEDDDDDLSPPPPPPGDPPPVFFARFPFAGDAQFPVYQTQTTTTTLTTVQFPAQPF